MEKLLAALLCLLVLTPVAVVGINSYNSGTTVYFANYEYNETTDTLSNPYCGWYSMFGYSLTDASADTFDATTQRYLQTCTDTRLVMLEINLKNFNTGDLSDNALAQLDRLISTWGSNGHNLIVRFLYDWDGKAKETEPATINIIQKHMSQTAEIINRYTDYVYIMQGIFVGNFAEMNNSNYMSEENMLALAGYLDGVIDSSIYLSVRTPQHLRMILGTSTLPDVASTIINSRSNFRIGLFNDGCLGSSIDVGTYGSSDMTFSETNYKSKGNRTQEISYQNTLCLMVPNGGEAVLDNSYNDIDNAAIDLAAMHVSYLNRAHDMSVINKWKRTYYSGSGVWNGSLAYDYIGAHLGYRYVLRESTLVLNTFRGTSTVRLSIENVGFAPTYRDFNVHIYTEVTDADGNSTITDTDLSDQTTARSWYPGQITLLRFSIPTENAADATVTYYLKVTDKTSGETIKFASDTELTQYGYVLGTVSTSSESAEQ